ncbi:thioredoxin family protein [Dysgonomonas sp. Marseille-P4677]|uniref:thioredoxin family protein n=1 Tax=Dysgonomonas sp. Marseille-P4677 TaxID=2364790 RepID=UPI001914BA99|nr:thioredoxin family protein [Dysgonomonas sp. Marseille-P4677]MBK5722346.1 thioredoxin family protein [Dysgonomonas sp. Marseille-P4677]
MKRILLLIGLLVLIGTGTFSQGYQVGDVAADFKLRNVDDTFVSLADYNDAKGYIVIFTCNHCPYAQAYQERIVALDQKYKVKGYPVIAINPNSPTAYPADSFDEMKKRHREAGYTFPYLFDDGQKVYPTFGATKTPHVFVLERTTGGNIVRYIGTIDDNYEDASSVRKTYVADAVDALLAGQPVAVATTKAIGCGIK